VLLWRFSTDLKLLEAERRRWSGWLPDNLRKDFSPTTVIDVGTAGGTPVLYEAFPNAYHVLIEPLREHEQKLKRWVAQQGGEYLLTAVGDGDEIVTIHVDPNMIGQSSILRAVWGLPEGSEQRTVPMTSLDKLLEQRRWNGPFGLKIDTEGFEQRVIEGSARLLEETQFVIAEVSVSKRFEDSYAFADFIALMNLRGFVASDILDGLKSSPNGEVVFIDVLFRRDG
jgi:FkbM family methyltransferase